MRKYSRYLLAPLALSVTLALGACAGDGANEDSASVDSGLSRDLDLANRDTTTPNPSDAPRGGAATTPRPSGSGTGSTARPTTPATPTTTPGGNTQRPGTGAARETTGTISSGTTIQLASGERVCTNTHRAGDRFIATVSNTVTGSNGVTIPAGSRVQIQVTAVQRSSNANEAAILKFNVVNVEVGGRTYPLEATVQAAATQQGERTGKDAQKVATGAAIGAIAGQILGKNTKGTVIGAAVGAAAGTAVAVATANYEGCIPAGGNITISLTAPATIGIATN
jgi:hypothetical protein